MNDPARTALVYLFRLNASGLEVLLLKRSPIPRLQGFLEGVSGRCLLGETYGEAARREVLEETGFDVDVEAVDYIYSFDSTDHPGPTIEERVFIAWAEGEPRLSPEHSDWRWCRIDDALHLLHWPDNVEALRRASANASRIFHIARRIDWEMAEQSGMYTISTLDRALDEVGFVHCSFKEQVVGVADFIFKGVLDLVILEIDTALVEAEVRVENLDGGRERFPHIYGPIPARAVVGVHPLETATDGSFKLPAGLTSSA